MIIKLNDLLSDVQCSKLIEEFDKIEDKKKFTDADVENHEGSLDSDMYWNITGSIFHKDIFPSGHLDIDKTYRMIKYKEEENFRLHTDTPFANPMNTHRLLIYLSDCEGGETIFPYINANITPKKGLGIIFPMNYVHGSSKIRKGLKYILALELRIHESDYFGRPLSDFDKQLLGNSPWFEDVYKTYCSSKYLNASDLGYSIVECSFANRKYKNIDDNGKKHYQFNIYELKNSFGELACDIVFYIKGSNIDELFNEVKIGICKTSYSNKSVIYEEESFTVIYHSELKCFVMKPNHLCYPVEPPSQSFVFEYYIKLPENVEIIKVQYTSIYVADHKLRHKLYTYNNLSGPNGMFVRNGPYDMNLRTATADIVYDDKEFPILNRLRLKF
jgi:hypothetical protein